MHFVYWKTFVLCCGLGCGGFVLHHNIRHFGGHYGRIGAYCSYGFGSHYISRGGHR